MSSKVLCVATNELSEVDQLAFAIFRGHAFQWERKTVYLWKKHGEQTTLKCEEIPLRECAPQYSLEFEWVIVALSKAPLNPDLEATSRTVLAMTIAATRDQG
jgi:hypothetical protein